ncbi:hypothetical protein [Secundilactobacillus kimchicus]|uniref:hypothetical protein n=1 Tax=Secundilactobacillus kimchicus TaxID=528209 RepID=UPI0024A976B4|nr:hypothetical protein [Secundilactobacillus kimchicus]
MKKTLKISLLLAMTLFIGGGIVAAPPFNPTKNTVQAAESTYQVKFLIDIQAGNQSTVPFADGDKLSASQIPVSALNSTTYLALAQQSLGDFAPNRRVF